MLIFTDVSPDYPTEHIFWSLMNIDEELVKKRVQLLVQNRKLEPGLYQMRYSAYKAGTFMHPPKDGSPLYSLYKKTLESRYLPVQENDIDRNAIREIGLENIYPVEVVSREQVYYICQFPHSSHHVLHRTAGIPLHVFGIEVCR